MGWRHDQISGEWTPWGRRRALTVDCSAATASPVDVTWTIPESWDAFWTTIDASGAELRVCDADGHTLLSYAVTSTSGGSFDLANRDGRIQIDGLAVTVDSGNARVRTVWLYFDGSGAPAAGVSVTITSPVNAYMETGRPRARVLSFGEEAYGATQPRNQIQKASGESLFVYLDVTDLLRSAVEPLAGSLALEEVAEIGRDLDVKNGVTSNPGMSDHSKLRILSAGGRSYVRLWLTGGTDGTDYTGIVPITTTSTQVIEARFLLAVRDTNEE